MKRVLNKVIILLTYLTVNVISIQAQEPKGFTFAQICDTQLGMGGYEHDIKTFKQAVIQINALKPDMVFICGDLVSKANEKSFNDFNTIKSQFTMPCHCASGNHDVGNRPTAKSLKYYREKIGKDYFSVFHKGYTFIIVNTQLWKAPLKGESEKHEEWLKKTLKEAQQKESSVFIIAHYPLFLKNINEKTNYFNLPIKKRKELLKLYKDHGVIAVLAGHTHKTLINEHQGIQLVNGETTSKNFDKRPLGFRLWTVRSPEDIKHKFIAIKIDDK